MEIKHKEINAIGEFYFEDNDEQVGRLVYRLEDPGTMDIRHTEVNKSHEGRGLAKKLVLEAIGYARNHKLRVVATCPYAAAVIRRDPSLQDVL